VLVDLDNLGPTERPVLAAQSVVVREPFALLNGEAPGAVAVEIQRGNLAVDTLAVDAQDLTFSGPVAVVAGENIFRAFSLDAAGNRSPPSSPNLTVFFASDNVFSIPGPFTPGDEFFLALLAPADHLTLRIFNLEGMELARLEEGSSEGTYEIPWDGRDSTGEMVSSGPYLAVADVELSGGSRELIRKAFVFGRFTKVEP
jgi:hypothetical protein